VSQIRSTIRCAVYTRKSSEEGLEQSFNSLHAQREACEAYVLSQRHEGWQLLPTQYDDGGFSGGNMERPGLKKLLDDIASKKIDTVVVYKVDRLTRALSDFARIVETFDKQGVSFVSVTCFTVIMPSACSSFSVIVMERNTAFTSLSGEQCKIIFFISRCRGCMTIC
jgi:predicted site-specific integrase-resolvase